MAFHCTHLGYFEVCYFNFFVIFNLTRARALLVCSLISPRMRQMHSMSKFRERIQRHDNVAVTSFQRNGHSLAPGFGEVAQNNFRLHSLVDIDEARGG